MRLCLFVMHEDERVLRRQVLQNIVTVTHNFFERYTKKAASHEEVAKWLTDNGFGT